MKQEITVGEYPEGFIEWNSQLMKILLDGIDKYSPELVIGALETLKIVYLEMALDKRTELGDKNG